MVTLQTSQGGKGSAIRRVLTPVKIMILAALLIILASVWTWWHYVYNSQDNIFWGMVRNNLSTSSYTRNTVQDDGTQRLEQDTVTRTSEPYLLNSQSILTQSQPKTEVVTDYIGTPYEDYVRYANIETEQKSLSGGRLDVSSIEGKWGKSAAQGTRDTSGQMYSESILGVIPFGKLSPTQRESLLRKMQSAGVYTFELTKVERKNWWSRPVHNYDVQVNAEAYVAALKQFAADMGLTQLERLDPAQYKSAQPITINVKVDGWSHQLTQVNYSEGSRVENISGHGSRKQLQEPPTKTISIEELQSKLQSLQ
jgi:hypothetical protein